MSLVWSVSCGDSSVIVRNGDELSVGKGPECVLRCDDPAVSRAHGRLFIDRGELKYVDLGSTNKTWLEGREIEPHVPIAVSAGQRLQLAGRVALEVRELAPTAREEPAETASTEFTNRGSVDAWNEKIQRYQLLVARFAQSPPEELDLALHEAFLADGLSDPALQQQLKQELLGNGPLDELLTDASVSEIIVNGTNPIWIEREGNLTQSTARFVSNASILQVIRRMVAQVGRKIDHHVPFVDARLPGGERLCAVIEPAVLHGPHLCVRRFPQFWPTMDELAVSGAISSSVRAHLLERVHAGDNILICGATGSGKTTLLNALASQADPKQRLITLEDTAELQIRHPHVVRLEARPPNIEGEGEISLRALLRTALRLRPDRLIVGECRGPEAIDLLQALNTGHAGSMASIHASSCREALGRLELLCLLDTTMSIPVHVLRTYIASAIQTIIFMERRDGRRQIGAIEEIRGLEDGVFLLRRVPI